MTDLSDKYMDSSATNEFGGAAESAIPIFISTIISTGSRSPCLNFLAAGVGVDRWDRLAAGVGEEFGGSSCAIERSDNVKTSKADVINEIRYLTNFTPAYSKVKSTVMAII